MIVDGWLVMRMVVMLVSLLCRLVSIIVLVVGLSVEVMLSSMSRVGAVVSARVVVICWCCLFDSDILCLLIIVLMLLGSSCMKLVDVRCSDCFGLFGGNGCYSVMLLLMVLVNRNVFWNIRCW